MGGGNAGIILHTDDGGLNWSEQNSNSTHELRGVYFFDELTGWMCGGFGTIVHTTDGGSNWIVQHFDTAYHLNSVSFLSIALEGWVAGELTPQV